MGRATWVCTYHDGTVLNGELYKFHEIDRSKAKLFRVMGWQSTELPLAYAKRTKITLGRGVEQVCHVMLMSSHIVFVFEVGARIVRRETFDPQSVWFRPIKNKQLFFRRS